MTGAGPGSAGFPMLQALSNLTPVGAPARPALLRQRAHAAKLLQVYVAIGRHPLAFFAAYPF